MTEAQRIIGACVRFFREKERLSQETLAAKAGISYQYLSGVETGKENFTVHVADSLSRALGMPLRMLVSAAYDNAAGITSPLVKPASFRRTVPLPDGLTFEQLEATLNLTQSVVHRINRNMMLEGGVTLQNLIQANNFSGLVSNVLSNSFDKCSPFKHNHDQRYPDLISGGANSGVGEGLEIKTTINVGKGGESHNGHGGWHVVACYNFAGDGDIQFVHVMFARLNGHQHAASDWKYTGSKPNVTTGSRRTETYSTNLLGTTKLRDGSAYLDAEKIRFDRWKFRRNGDTPTHSIWADVADRTQKKSSKRSS